MGRNVLAGAALALTTLLALVGPARAQRVGPVGFDGRGAYAPGSYGGNYYRSFSPFRYDLEGYSGAVFSGRNPYPLLPPVPEPFVGPRPPRVTPYRISDYTGAGYQPPPPSGSGLAYPPPAAVPPARPAEARVSAEFFLPRPDAVLFVEGVKMDGTGAARRFVSPPLAPGRRYTYSFEARWVEDGKEVRRTREVPVYAGDRITVDFGK